MSENSPPWPGEVLAAELRDWRQRHGLTATEVAQRVAEVGIPITREAIERVERGERQVRVDELVALGVALQVPLGVLLFGLGRVDEVGPPGAVGHPDMWQQWLEAEEPSPGVRLGRDPFWKIAATPVWAYQELRRWSKQVKELRESIERARIAGSSELVAKRIDEYLAALPEADEIIRDMANDGVRRPSWVPEFLDDAKQLKEERDGQH